MNHLWFFFAMGAAVLWGFCYAATEKLMRAGFAPSFLMLIASAMSLPLYLAISLRLGSLKEGVSLLASSRANLMWALAIAAIATAANLLIYLSVHAKNATLAAVVEVSYPLFTMLFAWIIMRELQVNLYTGLGGALIFLGIAIIFFKG